MRPPESSGVDQDWQSALIFALVAERLTNFYEHHTWLTIAQGATLAAEWLTRSKLHLTAQQCKHLSSLSDQLARSVADAVSREAGLHISYEMTEALDERYVSEIGESIREECRQLLINSPLPDQ